MGITRWGHEFDGPYFDPSNLSEDPGVYLIECVDDGRKIILDVGESDNVRDRIFGHERKDCWEDNCTGRIYYSVAYMLYESEEERRDLESRIRHSEDIICGER